MFHVKHYKSTKTIVSHETIYKNFEIQGGKALYFLLECAIIIDILLRRGVRWQR